jgi:hypothetical protein
VAQILMMVEEEVQQQVESFHTTQRQQVEDQVGATITSIMPTLLAWLKEWYKTGEQGPPRFPTSRPATRTTWRYWGLRRRQHWCLRRCQHWYLRRHQHWCLWRRHYFSSMHPSVRRIGHLVPRQQAAPPSLARPLSAVPRH